MVNNQESLEHVKSNSFKKKKKNKSNFLGEKSEPNPTRTKPETPKLESHSQENRQQKMTNDKVPKKKPNIKYKGKKILSVPGQEPLSLPHADVSSDVEIKSGWKVTGKRSKSHVDKCDKEIKEAAITLMMMASHARAVKVTNQEFGNTSRHYELLDDDKNNGTYYSGRGISTVGSSSRINDVIRNDDVDETKGLENNMSKYGALNRMVCENNFKKIKINDATPQELEVGRQAGNQNSTRDDVVGTSNVEGGHVDETDESVEILATDGALHQVEVLQPCESFDLNAKPREWNDLNVKALYRMLKLEPDHVG